MDTSETYIKMCDCEELYRLAISIDVKFNYFAGIRSHRIYYGGIDTIETNYIWLPRQDQLQEMILPTLKYGDTEHLLRALNQWDNSEVGYEPYSRYFLSMEQLWLAFVMKEKYNETWDGTSWIST